jgi:two-component system sensor kinase FixL
VKNYLLILSGLPQPMNQTNLEQSRFFTLLDAAVDGIVLINEQGVIERVNPAVEALFEFTADELIGNNVKMLMPDGDRLRHDDYIQHYLETGERRIIGIGRETIGQRKDHSQFPLYLSVGHIKEPSQSGFVGILRDLTSQRDSEHEMAQTELEIRQLRERLVHVARVSTLGEMVTGIAHEVNQPLTVIATYAQGCRRMIDGGLDDPAELLEALNTIASQAERAATVISRIRNFAKKSELVQVASDCSEILAEVLALAEVYAAEASVKIVTQFESGDLPLVKVDPIQIQQVVLNLINNAIESMSDVAGDKVVTVCIGRRDEDTVEVSVADTGEGIAVGIEEKVFDTFFSTKPSGLGIGLAICQSLVQAQGGKITVQNNRGPGCTFRFTLPAIVSH